MISASKYTFLDRNNCYRLRYLLNVNSAIWQYKPMLKCLVNFFYGHIDDSYHNPSSFFTWLWSKLMIEELLSRVCDCLLLKIDLSILKINMRRDVTQTISMYASAIYKDCNVLNENKINIYFSEVIVIYTLYMSFK